MKLIEIEKEFFINEKLVKKYNAIVRFLKKNKNVIYEAGCINRLIVNVEYEKGENNFLDNTEDYIILTLDNNKKIYVDDARGLRIDRKYKTIESNGHFNILR